MNNSMNDRFSVQASAEANYLTITLEEPVRLDSIALSMLQEDRPDFLLPVQIKTLNDSQSLRYKLVNAISLSYSLEKTMTRANYIKLALDLLTPFIKCRDWFLDYHYICIDPRYILRDKRSGSFLFVYMPEYSLRNEDEEIIAFFESILDYIDISDDREFQISIMHYFRNGAITLSELYQMFITERGKTASAPAPTPEVKKPPVRTAPATTEPPKTKPAAEDKPAKNDEPKKEQAKTDSKNSNKRSFMDWFLGKNPSDEKQDDNPLAGISGGADGSESNASLDILFGDSSKKNAKAQKKTEKPAEAKPQKQSAPQAIKSDPKPTPAPRNYVNTPPTYPMSDGSDDVTNIVDLSDDGRVYLELIDSMFPNVPKAIDIDMSKPYVTIGRATADSTGLDIAFPESCKGISRKHARIMQKDGGLVITDLGSAYFTVLNGQRLIPNAEYPLTNGSVLEFVQSKPIRYRVHC